MLWLNPVLVAGLRICWVRYRVAPEFFWGGVVSYSDSSKISVLNVEEDILGHFGAVSAATAKAMARGVRLLSSSDWALAITGIAGPGGGTREKPVGTVHMAICSARGLVKSQEFHFRGNRRRVRRAAACMALKFLIDNISLG